MPRFCTSSLVRVKSWPREVCSSRTRAAICSERYSTAPPPMVPQMRPSFPTSIRAPAPRGVAPEEAMTVTSTSASPASSHRAMIFSIFFTLGSSSKVNISLASFRRKMTPFPAGCRSVALTMTILLTPAWRRGDTTRWAAEMEPTDSSGFNSSIRLDIPAATIRAPSCIYKHHSC